MSELNGFSLLGTFGLLALRTPFWAWPSGQGNRQHHGDAGAATRIAPHTDARTGTSEGGGAGTEAPGTELPRAEAPGTKMPRAGDAEGGWPSADDHIAGSAATRPGLREDGRTGERVEAPRPPGEGSGLAPAPEQNRNTGPAPRRRSRTINDHDQRQCVHLRTVRRPTHRTVPRTACDQVFHRAPCRSRTDDLRITSALLWPAELTRQREQCTQVTGRLSRKFRRSSLTAKY